MSALSGIKPSEETVLQLKEFIDPDSTDRALKLYIKGESIEVDETKLEKSGSESEDIEHLPTIVTESECAYLIYKLDNQSLLLIRFTPPNVSIRQRTIFAATGNSLANSIPGKLLKPIQCSRLWELKNVIPDSAKMDPDLAAAASATSSDSDATSDHMIGMRRSYVPSTVSGFKFSEALISDLTEVSQNMSKDEVAALIFKANDKTELIELTIKLHDVTLEKLLDSLKDTLVCYIALLKLNPDDDNELYMSFIYVCKETAPIREKMVNASNRLSVLQKLKTITPKKHVVLSKPEYGKVEDIESFDVLLDSSSAIENTQSAGDAKLPLSSSKFQRPRGPGRAGGNGVRIRQLSAKFENVSV